MDLQILNPRFSSCHFVSANVFFLIFPSFPSVISILSSTYCSVTFSRRQCLWKMWPIQLVFLPFYCTSVYLLIARRIYLLIAGRVYLFSMALCNFSSFFARSVQLISSIFRQHHILKLLQECFAPLSKVSTLQHHTKLCSKFSTLLDSSSNLSQFYWRKVFLLLNPTFAMKILYLVSCVNGKIYRSIHVEHLSKTQKFNLRKWPTKCNCVW
jgi:hypothetical protein